MRLGSEVLTGAPATAHILGGAVMGETPASGVIDAANRVFGYANMYVCDGSAISANPGVNPSLSITALTEHAMSKIPARANATVAGFNRRADRARGNRGEPGLKVTAMLVEISNTQDEAHAREGFRCLADIEAFEKAQFLSRELPATTYEAIRRGAAIDPEAPALSFFVSARSFDAPRVFSHRELFAKITQTANTLRRLGIGRADVVAYVLPNLPETHLTIWGGSAAGRVLAINPLLEADQIADLLRAADAKLVVTLEKTPGADIWEKVRAAAPTVPGLTRILTCSVFDSLVKGSLATSAFKGLSHLRGRTTTSLRVGNRNIPISRLLNEIEGERSDALDFAPPQPDDISTMLCTGGTTGLPKIARRSHRSEVYDCWALSQFNPVIASPGSSVFCGLPLFHSNAILVTGLLPFMSGGHVVLATPQGYRGDDVIANFWKMADHYGFVAFSGVPTVYAALLDMPRDGLDTSSIVFGACGAAPMPVELFNSFVEQTGIPIVEGYGLTEGAVASSLNPTNPDRRRIGSIGLRLPYQAMRCAVLDQTDKFERWAEADEIGVIMISGPNVFDGYIVESQNQGVLHEIDGAIWFNTGDLARQDADGYFWMTGRKKELIIRGGHNIDPRIIEEAMHKHPAIAMAAAVGRPDAKAGEVPVLYYQSSSGTDVAKTELLAFAETHVPERAAVPKDFIRLEKLPVTAVGKIHKVSLNMMEIDRTIRSEARAAQAEIAALDVVQDNQRGVVAKLRLNGRCKEMRRALGTYTFFVDFENTAEG